LLLLGACGDDGGDDVLVADEEDAEAAGVDTDGGGDAVGDDPSLDAVTVEGAFGEEATVTFESPFDTETTVRRVLEEGDGELLETGMTVGFRNVEVNGRDGNQFDDSFPADDDVTLSMDETQIIPGLVRGLLGVPVGSRVLIAVAPADGFEPRGGIPDAGVEPGDTVVFVIDVMEASVPLTRAEGEPVAPADGLPTVELAADGTPTITIPDGEPPNELVVQPLIEGDGPTVEEGQTITAHYTGVIWDTGEQFDSSWDRGEPAQFPIGVGGVIAGWDEGLVGQPVGSQVLLVIPPDKGYGPEGNASAGIEGDDTLVFVVDILGAG
jgi:peptidylprolyl isomerase